MRPPMQHLPRRPKPPREVPSIDEPVPVVRMTHISWLSISPGDQVGLVLARFGFEKISSVLMRRQNGEASITFARRSMDGS